jgi:hypothetical protein
MEMEETYDLHLYLEEMREAMKRWEALCKPFALTHQLHLPPDYRELILALSYRS